MGWRKSGVSDATSVGPGRAGLSLEVGLGGLDGSVSVLFAGLWSLTLLWHRDRGSANRSDTKWLEGGVGWVVSRLRTDQ